VSEVPAKSKSQQRAAGMALAAKRGEIPVEKLRGAAKTMFKMTVAQLEEFAGTRYKKLPMHKKKAKKQ